MSTFKGIPDPDVLTDTKPADRLNKAKTQMRLVVALIVSLALLSFVVLALTFLPFTPVTIYSYEPTRSEVCPGELIRVDVDSEIDPRPSRSVYSIKVQPEWIVVDVAGLAKGQTVEGAETTLPPEVLKLGRSDIQSNVLRPAPPQPGMWRHAAEVTVQGSAYGIPRPQILHPMADTLTTVLPPDHPKCEGTERPEGGF